MLVHLSYPHACSCRLNFLSIAQFSFLHCHTNSAKPMAANDPTLPAGRLFKIDCSVTYGRMQGNKIARTALGYHIRLKTGCSVTTNLQILHSHILWQARIDKTIAWVVASTNMEIPCNPWPPRIQYMAAFSQAQQMIMFRPAVNAEPEASIVINSFFTFLVYTAPSFSFLPVVFKYTHQNTERHPDRWTSILTNWQIHRDRQANSKEVDIRLYKYD